MYYIRSFVRSIYDIDWLYKQRNSLAKGFVFIILLSAILAIVQGLLFTQRFPGLFHDVEKIVSQEVPNFDLSINEGHIVVEELAQPYQYEFVDGDGSFLLYVDTNTSSSIHSEDLSAEVNSSIIITSSSVFVKEPGSNGEYIAAHELNNLHFSKEDVLFFFEEIAKWISPGLLFAIASGILFIAITVAKILYTLFFGLLILLGLKLFRIQWSYEEIVAVGLFAHTLPSFIGEISRNLAPYGFPFLYTLLWLLLVVTTVVSKKQLVKE